MLAYTALQKGVQLFSVAPDGTGALRLSTNDAIEYEPVMSPDRTRIAFVSHRDGNAEIYVMNADGNGETRMTNHEAFDDEPAWSPDSRRLAFTSDRDGNRELYLVELEGLGLTRVTATVAEEETPSWSPDGLRLTFASDRDGDYEIFVVNVDGTGLLQVTFPSSANDLFPAWSPDGTRIAFTSDRDGDREIFVMSTDGSGVARLTQNEDDDYWSAWSPDGAQIVFVSDRVEGGDVFVMSADGTGQRAITAGSRGPPYRAEGPWVPWGAPAPRRPSREWGPSWTPDGRILFASNRAANVAVEIVNLDGSGRKVLAPSLAADGLARWSPDGRRLAFASERGGDAEIFVVSAAGGPPRRLTRNQVDDVFPTWSPDGKRIAFLRGPVERPLGLFVMNADGRRAKAVLYFSEITEACCSVWSPDATRIAFTHDEDIVVVNADGGVSRRVTAAGRGQGSDSWGSPSWSPDGRRLRLHPRRRLGYIRRLVSRWPREAADGSAGMGSGNLAGLVAGRATDRLHGDQPSIDPGDSVRDERERDRREARAASRPGRIPGLAAAEIEVSRPRGGRRRSRLGPHASDHFAGTLVAIGRREPRCPEGDELVDRGVDVVHLEPDRDRAVRVVVEAEVRRRRRPADVRIAERCRLGEGLDGARR